MVSEFNVIYDIVIKTNDRVSIFGKTGAGKSYFSKNWLLPNYTHYVFWDVQHQHTSVIHDVIVHTPKELEKNISEHRRILYQPKSPSASDFDAVCKIVFESTNTTLYVDEAASVSTPTKILYWHKIIMQQGRSYNTGIINTSQRPRDIHNTLISESEHLFIFTLNLETDIMKLRQQIGDAADEIRALPPYHFLYHNITRNKSFVFKPVRSFDPVTKEIHKLEIYRPTLKEYLGLAIPIRLRIKD